MKRDLFRRKTFVLLTALALAGCSSPEAAVEAGGDSLDACAIVQPAELESFFGKAAGEPAPAEGFGVVSGCEFRADGVPYKLHVTLSRPEPVKDEYEYHRKSGKDPVTVDGVGEAAHAVSNQDQTTLYFYQEDVLADIWTFYDAERTFGPAEDVTRLTDVARKVAERL